ncbi:MAG: hypothetical protein ACX930_01420 [Erythrobacter sp.]
MNKANIFLAAGWAGLASMVIYAIGAFALESNALEKAGIYLTMLCCWVLLFTRNADEYTRGLWTAAASLAFATILILIVGLPFFEGVYDGFRTALEDRDDNYYTQDVTAEAAFACAIVAFYVGLFAKRAKGDL